jgi:hypothetical protein
MNESCKYVHVVSAAIQSDRWDKVTSNHVASCAHCSDMVHITGWTRSLTNDLAWRPLPDPDLLWIEAAVLKAQVSRRRAIRLFLTLQTGCTAVFSALAAILVLDREGPNRFATEFLKWVNLFENLGPITVSLVSRVPAIASMAVLTVFTSAVVIRRLLLQEHERH